MCVQALLRDCSKLWLRNQEYFIDLQQSNICWTPIYHSPNLTEQFSIVVVVGHTCDIFSCFLCYDHHSPTSTRTKVNTTRRHYYSSFIHVVVRTHAAKEVFSSLLWREANLSHSWKATYFVAVQFCERKFFIRVWLIEVCSIFSVNPRKQAMVQRLRFSFSG